VILLHKPSGTERLLREHHGDPSGGIISPDERWAICGGKGVELHFIADNLSREFLENSDIHAMRWESPQGVRILVDPWSDQNATWRLDIESLHLTKICDGPDLRTKPYREDVTF
jgi:hypothetical protein